MVLLRLSILLEFFNSLHVLLVQVTPRPANCDSLVGLGQSSASAVCFRFLEACLKTSQFCESVRVGAKLLVRNFLPHFLRQLPHCILPAKKLVRNDGIDCLPKFVYALRTFQFSTLHSAQSLMNLMIHLPLFFTVITSASLTLLSKQILHLPLKRECLSFFCTSVVQLLR